MTSHARQLEALDVVRRLVATADALPERMRIGTDQLATALLAPVPTPDLSAAFRATDAPPCDVARLRVELVRAYDQLRELLRVAGLEGEDVERLFAQIAPLVAAPFVANFYPTWKARDLRERADGMATINHDRRALLTRMRRDATRFMGTCLAGRYERRVADIAEAADTCDDTVCLFRDAAAAIESGRWGPDEIKRFEVERVELYEANQARLARARRYHASFPLGVKLQRGWEVPPFRPTTPRAGHNRTPRSRHVCRRSDPTRAGPSSGDDDSEGPRPRRGARRRGDAA